MVKKNLRIRQAMKEANVKGWELADYLGIREESLSRLLRYELQADKAGELLKAIEKLAKERGANE